MDVSPRIGWLREWSKPAERKWMILILVLDSSVNTIAAGDIQDKKSRTFVHPRGSEGS